LIALEDDKSSVLAILTFEQWKSVLFTCSEAVLLDIAERRPDDIQPFLKSIEKIQTGVKNEKK
jgi:hypothetical protein